MTKRIAVMKMKVIAGATEELPAHTQGGSVGACATGRSTGK